MSERFELHTLDSFLGGSLKSNLFDLEQYAQRMKVRPGAPARLLLHSVDRHHQHCQLLVASWQAKCG
jgi:hypothetical protein